MNIPRIATNYSFNIADLRVPSAASAETQSVHKLSKEINLIHDQTNFIKDQGLKANDLAKLSVKLLDSY